MSKYKDHPTRNIALLVFSGSLHCVMSSIVFQNYSSPVPLLVICCPMTIKFIRIQYGMLTLVKSPSSLSQGVKQGWFVPVSNSQRV